MNKAIFLDRDNTLIYDKGYTYKTDDLKWLKGSINCLKSFSTREFILVVITNQSGIARGYFSAKDVDRFHNNMNNDLFKQANISIDKFYFCPHFIDGKISRYRKKCECRKPGSKLYKKAINELSINPKFSIVIGDNVTDLIPAFELGVYKGYLLNNYIDLNPIRNKYPGKEIIKVNNWDEILDSDD